jgi:hypothetical protein
MSASTVSTCEPRARDEIEPSRSEQTRCLRIEQIEDGPPAIARLIEELPDESALRGLGRQEFAFPLGGWLVF